MPSPSFSDPPGSGGWHLMTISDGFLPFWLPVGLGKCWASARTWREGLGDLGFFFEVTLGCCCLSTKGHNYSQADHPYMNFSAVPLASDLCGPTASYKLMNFPLINCLLNSLWIILIWPYHLLPAGTLIDAPIVTDSHWEGHLGYISVHQRRGHGGLVMTAMSSARGKGHRCPELAIPQVSSGS